MLKSERGFEMDWWQISSVMRQDWEPERAAELSLAGGGRGGGSEIHGEGRQVDLARGLLGVTSCSYLLANSVRYALLVS